MIWRILEYGLFLAGVVLFGVATVAYYHETDEPGAVIENAEREFHDLKVGENVLTFEVHNPTRHKVRVVGMSSVCGGNCCVGPKDDIPFDIPAGASKNFRCVLDAKRPGPFETPIHVFFDDFGLRDQEFQVRGTAR